MATAAENYEGNEKWSGKRRDVPATDEARRWEGFGTALKPATEHWILARKPLDGTVARNVLRHGTGSLNIDGSRVPSEGGCPREGEPSQDRRYADRGGTNLAALPGPRGGGLAGRWPANLLLSHAAACEPKFSPGSDCPACEDACDCTGNEPIFQPVCSPGCPVAALDEQSGFSTTPATVGRGTSKDTAVAYGSNRSGEVQKYPCHSDSGGASRFFPRFKYAAKASTRERSAGLAEGEKNKHPTVKSIELMRWLCRLVSPPGGTVLDPFMGSGSTGVACAAEGFRFCGIEKSAEYLGWARARVAAAYEETGR